MNRKLFLSLVLFLGSWGVALAGQPGSDGVLEFFADSMEKLKQHAREKQQDLDRELRVATQELVNEGKGHFLIPSPSKRPTGLAFSFALLGLKVAANRIVQNPETAALPGAVSSFVKHSEQTLSEVAFTLDKLPIPIFSEFDTVSGLTPKGTSF